MRWAVGGRGLLGVRFRVDSDTRWFEELGAGADAVVEAFAAASERGCLPDLELQESPSVVDEVRVRRVTRAQQGVIALGQRHVRALEAVNRGDGRVLGHERDGLMRAHGAVREHRFGAEGRVLDMWARAGRATHRRSC